MRLYILLLFALLFPTFSSAQTVVSQRIADLQPQNYNIQGDAILSKLDDGSIDLLLTDDFGTPRGPDVRILLGNSLSMEGAVEIVNLSNINHFSGALSVDVPAEIELEQYDLVIFYCVAFRQLWASGTLGEVMNIGGEATCSANSVQIEGVGTSIAICPDDNQADLLTFSNTLNLSADSNYAYLLTDENDILQEVIQQDSYDFEGSGSRPQRVYGIHYDGTINAVIGANRLQTSASNCHEHSDNFISVTKSGCVQVFACEESATATTNWVSEVNICPTDGMDDNIPLKNNLFIAPGEHYAYLLTDTNEILQGVILDSVYNFEGSGLAEQRVYGIHYDGNLIAQIGQHRTQTTADGDCFTHSSSDLYLSIKKTSCAPVFECEESATATTNWVSEVNICPIDGMDDNIPLKNNLFIAPGEHYAYLLTDTNEILQGVILDSVYNFEGSGIAEQRVYGIHYDGNLIAQIGQHRSQTTADGDCFTHSSGDLYLSIKKTSCAPVFACEESATATTNWVSEVNICPTDGMDDNIPLKNNLFIAPGEHYAYLLTDTNEILQGVILDSIYNFEGSGLAEQRVYGIHYDGNLIAQIGQHRNQTTADGDCFTHSSSDLYLSIKKTACAPAFECKESATATTNWVSEVNICPMDEMDDIIPLKNNLFIAPGRYYAYLLTDTNEILQEVILDSVYNFEGSGLAEQRVYGIHYEGSLSALIGAHRTQTKASRCYQHSSADLYLTIKKEDCPPYECLESLTATHNWVTEVDICSNDGQPDGVFLQNNLLMPPGTNYTFLLTDANEILQEVITDTTYNFEGTGTEEQRVYGLSYAGELMSKIGEHRMNTTASECYIHSGANLFIRINKTAACATSTFNQALARQVVIFPNPVQETLQIKLPDTFLPEQIEVFDLLGRQQLRQRIDSNNNRLNIDVRSLAEGTYLLRMNNQEHFITSKIVVTR